MLFLLLALAQVNVTRVEQSDPAIAYTGTWYPNNNSLNSGGSAVLANLKGSQAVLTFSGTGITWIGTSDGFSGIAYVYLDGAPSQVDTGNSTGATLYQQPLFAAHGLSSGLHTLTIEITHSHDESTNQSWIWIDAFDIENGSPVANGTVAGAGLAEQTNAAVTYGGHWFQNTGLQFSGGSAVQTSDAGAWINFRFQGAAVDWIGYRDEYSGIAQVYVDGALLATVDTYATPAQAQAKTYSVSGLALGPHALKILVTGGHGATSGGAAVWVDAFSVTGSSGRPAINAGGVVSSASYVPAPRNQVTAGQIVSIFGSGFLPGGHADASSLPLPRQLGSTNVTVNACGQSIPLYSVFPTQINAQLPFECPASGSAPLTVSANGQTSAAETITLAPGSPGVFTVNASGSGDGVILHANNSLVNSANPARGGEQVVVYATGLGATSPSFATGAAVTANNRTLTPVTAAIGGMNAIVVFSGLTMGFAGLYQVNLIVPAGLSGSQTIVLTAGPGAASPGNVNIFVAQ